jgi:transcriptional repressor NrdR
MTRTSLTAPGGPAPESTGWEGETDHAPVPAGCPPPDGIGAPRSQPRCRVGLVRCPRCSGLEDRVVDSRTADDGAAIRRRRECLTCGRRFTTYERLEEVPFVVIKRSGQREPFERAKLVAGMQASAKNRPLSLAALEQIAAEIDESLRLEGPEVTSQQVGLAVLDALRGRDHVAYLRFASVYKGFTDAGDFQREAGLLTKLTTPKSRKAGGAQVPTAEEARKPG